MLDTFYDGVNFFKAWVFAVIIWGTLCVAVWYNFFSEARRSPFHSGGLSDFIDLFPDWLVNGVLSAWLVIGTFPFLNYVADKEQFGSVVDVQGKWAFSMSGRGTALAAISFLPWC